MTKTDERTLPGFPNSFPYNELLLNGTFDIGEYAVKTRSWNWNYRGPLVLYTSTSTCKPVADAYGLNPKEYPRCVIVGAGEIADVRELNEKETLEMFLKFNPKASRKEAVGWAKYRTYDYYDDRVLPCDIGFFFKNLKRFKKPIPFKPPQGAISVFRVPLILVAKSLKEVGIKIN